MRGSLFYQWLLWYLLCDLGSAGPYKLMLTLYPPLEGRQHEGRDPDSKVCIIPTDFNILPSSCYGPILKFWNRKIILQVWKSHKHDFKQAIRGELTRVHFQDRDNGGAL